MSAPPLVALAAGGTGGHVFPARALAEALLARGWRVALVTDRRGQAFGEELGVSVHRISAASPAGGARRAVAGIVSLGTGLFQARGILRRLAPAAVAGFGGYPSVPTIWAAAMLGAPTLIHEQNALMGRANRLWYASPMRTQPCRASRPANRIWRPAWAAAVAMLLAAPAGADVFHVPLQIPSVHSAVNIAQPGDTVLVAPGTYVENVVWPPWSGVVLLAEKGPAETILDGGALEAVISIETAVDSTTVIRGFTIRNGHTEGT